MIWTAWNNGEHHRTGAGYGFEIDAADRDRYFDRRWTTVVIELPTDGGFVTAEPNVAKNSFWDSRCRELIDRSVGRWLLGRRYAPWPDGDPPKFEVQPAGEGRFRVLRRVAA